MHTLELIIVAAIAAWLLAGRGERRSSGTNYNGRPASSPPPAPPPPPPKRT